MKRVTERLKRLDWIATWIDIAYGVLAVALFIYAFVILVEPESLREVVNITYHQLGLSFTSAQLNLFIGILVGYMLVFIPIAIINAKRLSNKEYIEIDKWSYRTQHLHGVMALVTFNIFSAAIRAYVGYEMKKIVVGYGFKQTMVNAGVKIALLVKVDTWKTFGKSIAKGFKVIGQFIVAIGKFILKLFRGETWRHAARYTVDAAYRDEIRKEKRRREEEEELESGYTRTYVVKVTRLVVTYTFLSLMAIFIIIPFYWMMLTALKSDNELTTLLQPRFFMGISEMQWVNFKVALTQFNFMRYLGNTIFVGIVSMVGTVLTTILASFAFARLKFAGREFIFSLLLMTMMIPGELYTITNFITINNWFHLGDTYAALILPFMTSVFYIFFLRQTFKQIPETLYQAARVDGCGDFKYLTRIMLPIARPTIITIVILSSIGAWSAYIWPRLVIRDENKWLISVALRSLNFSDSAGDARTMFNYQLAATSIVTVPLLILFFSLKKFIISGVGRSGTKG